MTAPRVVLRPCGIAGQCQVCGAPPDADCLGRSTELLRRCGNYLLSVGFEFTGPTFTDRHGDGPRMLRLAREVFVALGDAESVAMVDRRLAAL